MRSMQTWRSSSLPSCTIVRQRGQAIDSSQANGQVIRAQLFGRLRVTGTKFSRHRVLTPRLIQGVLLVGELKGRGRSLLRSSGRELRFSSDQLGFLRRLLTSVGKEEGDPHAQRRRRCYGIAAATLNHLSWLAVDR